MPVGNDEWSVVITREQLIVGANGVGLMQAIKVAFRLVHVRLRHRGPQVGEAESVGGQGCGICLDTYGWFLSTADADEAHAGQLRNLLGKPCVCQILYLRERQGLRSQCAS